MNDGVSFVLIFRENCLEYRAEARFVPAEEALTVTVIMFVVVRSGTRP